MLTINAVWREIRVRGGCVLPMIWRRNLHHGRCSDATWSPACGGSLQPPSSSTDATEAVVERRPFEWATHGATTRDGLKICYDYGPMQRPPGASTADPHVPVLFFAHATGFCRQVWRPVTSELSAHMAHEAVLVDLRGHGDSSPLPSTLGADGRHVTNGDWWQFAEDISATVTHVTEERDARMSGRCSRIGVGHSLGGAAVMMAQLANPSLFDALVLIEPVAFTPPYGRKDEYVYAMAAQKRRATFADRDVAAANFLSKEIFRRWDPRCLAAYVECGLSPTGNGAQVALKCKPDQEAEIYRMSWHALWDSAPQLRVPTVLIAASESFTHPQPFLDELARRIRGNSGGVNAMVVIDGASHLVPMESPQRIASEIAGFISAVTDKQ